MSTKQTTQTAFDFSTERFHIITTWIGLGLNLLWFVSDLFVLPEYTTPFFIFRLVVSTGTIALLLTRKVFRLSIYLCMFVLVCGISIQNAYMWSVMDVSHFQQHTFAYIVLFIGVGMLVLWRVHYSIALVIITVAANVVFYLVNSRLSLEQFTINGGLLTLTVLIFCVFLIRTRYRLTFREIEMRLDLEQSKQEIEAQKEQVEEKNREITDSITYARTIQQALLPGKEQLQQTFSDYFIVYLPKDIVSGDFYWVHQRQELTFFAVGDCTGHGVPGGFMTMLGLSFLEEIVIAQQQTDPGTILNGLRERIVASLNQKGSEGENKDGMDIALCVIDHTTLQLSYAGAHNDVYIIRENELHTLKAMRQPCGYSPLAKQFETVNFALQKGDHIYGTTDGFADQFGGPVGKKFRTKNLLGLLVQHADSSLEVQEQELRATFEKWKGNLEQVDDVLVVGVKV